MHQRVVHLSRQQLIEHIDGRGKQDPVVGLAGLPADDFGQKGLPGAGIADKDQVGALSNEVQIEQTQDLGFNPLAGLVVLEMKALRSPYQMLVQSRE